MADRGAILDLIMSERAQIAIAGALGGLVRTLTLREDRAKATISITVGAICAFYASPMVAPIFKPIMSAADPSAFVGFSGFLVGVGGVTVSGLILDVWRARRAQITGGPVHDDDRDA